MLKNIADLGLLDIPDDRNILRDLPLGVKLQVVSHIVKHFLHNYETAIQMLKTEAHVHWYMEVFEQSFRLPRQEFQIIGMTLDIYKNFIFEGENRPKPLIDNFQMFVREIFSHFSFLFLYEKEETGEVLREYISLCNSVLDVFLQVGRKGQMINTNTWIYLMKTLLGISDTVCRGQGLKTLSPGVLKVLFEFWICSMNCDITLWLKLQDISRNWMENIAYIHQWNSITRAFSLRTARHLYGELEGTDCVRIEWKGLSREFFPNINVGHHITDLYLPIDYTYFLWHILFYILGNPNDINSPENHLTAMEGIRDVVTIFAEIGKVPNIKMLKEKNLRLKYPPDGSTILKFCGDWLFETFQRSSEYNEGKAVAYETLCRLLIRLGGKPFSPEQLSLFYDFLQRGLRDEDITVKSAIITNCHEIFSIDLQGVFVLIPAFMNTCEAILCGRSASRSRDLRLSCVKIIASLICVSGHFKETVYKALKLQIQRNLLKSLKDEKDERNLQYILWAICSVVFDEVDNSKKVGSMFIHQMLKICDNNATKPSVQYSPIVFSTLYDVLSTFSLIHVKLVKNDKTIVREIVKTLCSQLPDQIKNLSSNPLMHYGYITKSYECVTDFVMHAFALIIPDEQLMALLIKSIDVGLVLDPASGKEIEQVFRCALFLSTMVHAVAGNFPGTDTYNTMTTTYNEETQLVDKKTLSTSDYVRNYLLNSQYLFSAIEQPVEKSTHGATVVSRSELGKFIWDIQFIMPQREESTESGEIQKLGTHMGATSTGLIGHVKEDEENQVLMKHHIPLDYTGDEMKIQRMMELIDQTHEVEMQKRAQVLPEWNKTDFSVVEDPSPALYETKNKFQISRFFFAHLGFFHCGHNVFYELVQCEEFEKFLTELDAVFPRETHQVSICYIKKGEDLPKQFLQNQAGSKKFNDFVKSMAWHVDLTQLDQDRYLGDLARDGSTGLKAPYFADYKNEVIYTVFTNLKDWEHKQKFFKNNRVNIIWTDSTREFKPGVIDTEKNQVNLLIHPTDSKLYKIKFHMLPENKVPVFGPLIDGMIVSEKVLIQLVNFTVINACHALNKLDLRYVNARKNRLRKIEQIAKKLKKGVTFDNMLATIFIHKSKENDISKQIAPKARSQRGPVQVEAERTVKSQPTVNVPTKANRHEEEEHEGEDEEVTSKGLQKPTQIPTSKVPVVDEQQQQDQQQDQQQQPTEVVQQEQQPSPPQEAQEVNVVEQQPVVEAQQQPAVVEQPVVVPPQVSDSQANNDALQNEDVPIWD